MEKIPPEPTVQLNIPIKWSAMQHLERVAHALHTSKSQAVRDALEMAYPSDSTPNEIAKSLNMNKVRKLRQDTSDAGATS